MVGMDATVAAEAELLYGLAHTGIVCMHFVFKGPAHTYMVRFKGREEE